jgi:hypothetical protein
MKSWASGAAAIVVGFLTTQAFAQAGNAARGERCANATGMVARWIVEDA